MGITLWQYYTDLAAELAMHSPGEIGTAARWKSGRNGLYRKFMRSLGLDPLPARCDLKVTDCGSVHGKGYRARKISFQILPDCWTAAAIYYPDPLPAGKQPGVLYLCGHGTCGIIHYQSHAMRWAQRGYVCLILDTIEQHDNPGEHHGLWTGQRPDWLSMGYTSAGGEVWNGIRALDVLAALPEVDPGRIGVTGVSGGGAQSLYVAIADERIRAVASSCGVSVPKDALQNRHLGNHCDCMYYHNLYGKDTGEFAALVAPRASLFYFSRHDTLFSPKEEQSFVERTKSVYRLLGCEDRCSSLLCHGPHGEPAEALKSIDLWFDQHVAGEKKPQTGQPVKLQAEAALTVFNGASPAQNRLDLLPELLSPRGTLELPRTPNDWSRIQGMAIDGLRHEVFGRLEALHEKLTLERVADSKISHKQTEFKKYGGNVGGMDVWLETLNPETAGDTAVIGVAGPDEDTADVLGHLSAHGAADAVLAAFEPRGTGLSAVPASRRDLLLRAAALVGLTPVMLMVQDLRLLMDSVMQLPEMKNRKIVLHGRKDAGVACLYAALLDKRVAGVVMEDPPASHRYGAPILGILRHLDLGNAIGLMATRPVAIVRAAHGGGYWANRLYARLGLASHLINEPDLKTALSRVMAITAKPIRNKSARKKI